MDYESGFVSAEGTAFAVKPEFSFQCTGIHHAVRSPTYNDEHLVHALNKSMAPLPFYPSLNTVITGHRVKSDRDFPISPIASNLTRMLAITDSCRAL